VRLCLYLSFIFKIIVLILVIMAQHKLYLQRKMNFTSTLKNSYTKLHFHTICSTHFNFFWFIDPDNFRCSIQIMKLFIMLFYPLFWYFLFCYTTLKNPGLIKKLKDTLWAMYRLPVNMSCKSNLNRWWRNQHRARFPKHFFS